MAFTSGTKLGPYVIVAPLGAGGMGEVYRARDTRLGREVALKALPEAFADDLDRRRRLECEARILGALNHPNLLAVFDVGTHGGRFFLVSELLVGETLRQCVAERPLPLRKAIDYALQLARGLAAAHGSGIFHRDLKPENILITHDDRLKILDFGVAKQVAPAQVTPDETVSLSIMRATTDVIFGTPDYMAPEQIRAQKVDHRADLFTFGAIFYEMVSGQRAFRGDGHVEIMNAILTLEPPDLNEKSPGLSPTLQRIIQRCLEKKPENRFQCASDLAFAIEMASDIPMATHPTRVTATRSKTAFAVALMAVVLSAAGAFRLGIRAGENRVTEFRRLFFGPGYISSARFTPDGQSVVFGAAFYGRPREIFSTRLDGHSWRNMDMPPADILGIAKNGKMALSLGAHNLLQWMTVGTLGEAPLSGGAPREILENVCDADITSDGNEYAIVRCGESMQNLEFPIGHVLFRSNGWISQPRISPQGDDIAFLEHPIAGDDRGYVSLVDMSGHKKRLTDEWVSEFGVAWSQSGKEIWFSSSSEAGPQEVRSVTRSGYQRIITSAATDVALHDISSDGSVLLANVRVSTEIHTGHKGGSSDRLLELREENVNIVGLSYDGKVVALGASGAGSGRDYSTLVKTEDMAEAVRLGDGDPSGISPDGKWILSVMPSQPSRLVLYPTGTGAARSIDISPVHIVNVASSWTSDGSRILFTGAERDGLPRAYLLISQSGATRPITPPGTSDAIISPDGQYVVARNSSNQFAVYPVSGGEAGPVQGLAADEFPIQWDISDRKLYVWNRKLPAKIFLLDIESGARVLWLEITPAQVSGLLYGEVCMTPDGRSYGYRNRRVLTDLFLAKGLR